MKKSALELVKEIEEKEMFDTTGITVMIDHNCEVKQLNGKKVVLDSGKYGCYFRGDSKNNKILFRRGGKKKFIFFNCYKQYPGILQVLECELSCRMIKEGETREFDIIDRFYIDRDKVAYDSEGRIIRSFERPGYYGINYCKLPRQLSALFMHHGGRMSRNIKNLIKFLGTDFYITKTGTVLDFHNIYCIIDYYRLAEKIDLKPKNQQYKDLLALDLKKVNANESMVEIINSNINDYWDFEVNNNIGYVENLKDYTVIRIFCNNVQHSRCDLFYEKEGKKPNRKEKIRIYFPLQKNKKALIFTSIDEVNWKLNNNIFNKRPGWRKIGCKIQNWEEFENSSRLKYIYKIALEAFDKPLNLYEYGVYELINIFNNPVIEQVKKLGFKNINNHITYSNYQVTAIKEIFGLPKTKKFKGALLKDLDMNMQQIEILNQHHVKYNSKFLMSTLRAVVSGKKIASLDLNKFKQYYEVIKILLSKQWYIPYGVYDSHFSINNIIREGENGIGFKTMLKIHKIVHKYNGSEDIFRIFFDGLNQYLSIPNTFESYFNFDFLSIEDTNDIVRFHDLSVEASNDYRRFRNTERAKAEALEEQQFQKKLEKNNEDRKYLEFEDDKYLIRLPKTLSEIKEEGVNLHHCVGGYSRRHAIGDTTILFLRNQNQKDKAFYTIEVNLENNKIVQIHGRYNRWLGNNPDAIPTVKKWLDKLNINCTDTILRSTSSGYSAGNAPLVEIQ